MSRFIQTQNDKPVKETKPTPKPKTGKYTSKDLEGTKKIHSGSGGKY